MATIVIKDLTENFELDRQAMQAIAGGARLRASAPVIDRPSGQHTRLFNLSPGRPDGPQRGPQRAQQRG